MKLLQVKKNGTKVRIEKKCLSEKYKVQLTKMILFLSTNIKGLKAKIKKMLFFLC